MLSTAEKVVVSPKTAYSILLRVFDEGGFMARTRPLGYKPQTVCGLLDVGIPTFRYWREHIEPHPRRAFFSAGDLLAFRIIKILIYRKHLSADLLSTFSFSGIFSTCGTCNPKELSTQFLLLDESDHSVQFVPSKKDVDPYNLNVHVLGLALVVAEQENAFAQLGNA